jgi:integrase
MALTDTSCKNAKPSEKPRKMADSGGLYLEVMPNGSKYWRMKYRFMKKEKRLAFGVYPLISLKEAREQRDVAKKLLFENIDPAQVKKEKQRALVADHEDTFEAVAREWLNKREGEIQATTLLSTKQRLERNLFPIIGDMPIRAITPPILLSALKQVEARGILDTVKRLRQATGQIYRYAIASGRAEVNPATDLADALKVAEVEHLKAMPLSELPTFIHKINHNEARLFRQTCLALKMMVLTFTRKKELAHAKWEEFDLEGEMWVIPAERMKMKKAHNVPLSKQVLEILHELKTINPNSEFVFPSVQKPRQPMHPDTILRALYKLNYKGAATVHGFRSLAMTTLMEELNYRYEIPDLQLAHSKGDSVRKAYDRTEFMDERIKMMQHWADYVQAISQESGNVITGKFGEVN